MSWLTPIAKWTLGTLLSVLALAKALSGHMPEYSSSPALFYSAALLEAILAVLLLSGCERLASLGVIVFFLIAGILTWFASDSPCGCLGTLADLPRQARLAISGAAGLLALVLLSGRLPHSHGARVIERVHDRGSLQSDD